MNFVITEQAMNELEKFSKEELLDNEIIRITRGVKCGGPKFELIVDRSINPLDKILEYTNLNLVVNEAYVKLLEGITLDFNSAGFIFEGGNDLSC